MKSMLIFPPGWDPRGPYLSLPVLKAFLKHESQEVFIRDENVNFYDEFFSEKFFRRLSRNNSNLKNSLYYNSIFHIDEAKKVVRSRDSNEEERRFAWNVFSNLNFLVGKCFEGFELDFNSLRFKYSHNSTDEIMEAISDRASNPLIDYFEKYSDVVQEIKEQKIDYVGFSVTANTQLIPTLTMCKVIRETCPSVRHIQLGGNFITRIANRIYEGHPFWKFIDSIMLYNGEENLSLFLEKLDVGNEFADVPNLYYLNVENKLEKNKIIESKSINDLTPDFDGFDFSKYFTDNLWLPIYTSRACVNRCTFCTIPNASGGQFRHMPAKKTVENMMKLKEKYDISHFSFVDETFLIPKMKQIAKLIIDSDEDISWYCETRFSKLLTVDTAKLLNKGGCSNIQFGLESYNQRVLDLMKKNVDISWIEPNIINCFEAGISVHLFFMTGFPTETLEEAKKTYDFANKMVMKSKSNYNLPYSTKGFGTFGLEVGSGVYDSPSVFAIDIIEPSPGEDLRLSRDYAANEGLSIIEAQQLVDEMKSSAIAVRAMGDLRKLDIEFPKSILPSEIDLINEREKNEHIKSYRLYGVLPKGSQIILNSYSTAIINEDNGMIIFYNLKNGIFLSYEISEVSLASEDDKKIITDKCEIAETLAYLDFIELKPEEIIYVQLEDIFRGNNKIVLNEYFVENYNDTDVLLYSKMFKEIMQTNILGHELLKYFVVPHTFREWYEEILKLEINFPVEKLKKLITDAMEAKLLKVINEVYV